MSGCPSNDLRRHNFERKDDDEEGNWIFVCSLCGERKMIEVVPTLMDEEGNPTMVWGNGIWNVVRRR